MRIGVNIPDELMQRLEPLKPDLNISQVCRDALEAKASSHERMLASMDDEGVAAAVQRVWEQEKKFRSVNDVDWMTLAHADAKDWVELADRKDWEHLHHRQEVIRRQGRPAWEVPPPGLQGAKDFIQRRGEFREYMQQNAGFFDWLYDEHGGIDYAAAEREYMTAWLAYTDAVWKLVVQKREEHYRSMLANSGTLHDPTVPDHQFGDAQPQEEPPFQVVPHHPGYAPGVDPLKLNHLIGDLDVEHFLAKRERLQ